MAKSIEEINNAQHWLRKGDLLSWAFDQAFLDSENRRALYDEAIALLDSDGALDRLTEYWSSGTASNFSEKDKKHFRNHWLNSAGTEKYLRAGFREVLEHAQERDVELNAIWFAAGDGEIQLGYVDNPNSVTVIIWTPAGAPKEIDPRVRYGDPFAKAIPRPGGMPGR